VVGGALSEEMGFHAEPKWIEKSTANSYPQNFNTYTKGR